MHAVRSTRRAPRRSQGIGLVVGFLADLLFADPRRLHPVAGFGALAARVEAALYKPTRARGLIFTVVLVGLPAAAAALAGAIRHPYGIRLPDAIRHHDGIRHPHGIRHHSGTGHPDGIGRASILALVTWASLGGCSLRRVATGLADRIDAGDLDAARAILPSLCGRDSHALDAIELCRAGLESVAENTSDAVVGALLWGGIAGPGGVAAYRAANTLDAMVGHRTDRYRDFGWAPARLDDLLNWPASRLTAILTALSAPLVGGSPAATWKSVRRYGAKHPSPNAGRVEAAFAGALNVGLGGRLSYAGVDELRPAIGHGPAPTTVDLRRATRLSFAVGALAAACAAPLAACAAACAAPLAAAGRPAGANPRARGLGTSA